MFRGDCRRGGVAGPFVRVKCLCFLPSKFTASPFHFPKTLSKLYTRNVVLRLDLLEDSVAFYSIIVFLCFGLVRDVLSVW